jgi:hydrogenase/urease accessory protein HupE
VLHIVPRGLDHVLFVLGLFLLSARLAPLLWQISAFTLAHTLTLALATLGVVQLPSRVVEASIAASIAWVGAVVVWRVWRNRPSESGLIGRVLVVFACGLLHGLGFAGVLGDVGLPDGELVPALIGFNVGVELGQLLVIGAAAVSIGLLRSRAWYPRRVALPLGLVIAAAGLFWTVERLA